MSENAWGHKGKLSRYCIVRTLVLHANATWRLEFYTTVVDLAPLHPLSGSAHECISTGSILRKCPDMIKNWWHINSNKKHRRVLYSVLAQWLEHTTTVVFTELWVLPNFLLKFFHCDVHALAVPTWEMYWLCWLITDFIADYIMLLTGYHEKLLLLGLITIVLPHWHTARFLLVWCLGE